MDEFHQVPWTCAPSGSLDGLKPHLLLLWVAFFSQSLPLSVTQVLWLEHSLVKTKAKNAIECLRLLHAQVTSSPISSQTEPTFSPVFLLSPVYQEQLFLML